MENSASNISIGNRNELIDIIKAVAIILVVVGHCIQFGGGNYYLEEGFYSSNIVYIIIYSFHMPLFALVSGYLFYFSLNKNSTKKIVVSRVKSCIFPNLAMGTILLLPTVLQGGTLTIRYIIETYLTTYWFLWGIFFCAMIVLIVNRFIKDNIFIYIAIIIASLFFPDILHIHLYKYILPFFLIGYFYNKNKNKKLSTAVISNKHLAIILIISIIVYAGLMFLWTHDSYIYSTKHCIIRPDFLYQLYLDVYRTVVGLVGSVVVITGIDLIYRHLDIRVLKKIFVELGKSSIGIYVFSLYLNQWVLRKVIYDLPYINGWLILAESILMLAVCFAITWIFRKFKVTRVAFLGDR